MPTTAPSWFDQEYFLGQKAEQMNVIKWQDKTDWTAETAAQALADASVSAWDNWEACNAALGQAEYATGIELNQLNVGPNQYFDPAYYAAAKGAAASMTPQAVLEDMLGTYHQSAWMHYDAVWNVASEGLVNPSKDFDVAQYIADVAQAWNASSYQDSTEWDQASVIDAIKNAGLNPVTHYYEVGNALGITPTAVSDPVQVPANWTPWGEGSGTPTVVDPYDQNFVDVAIEKGNTGPYEGQDNQNTHFNAVWDSINAATVNTLAAGDVINGGTGALNSLVVDFGKDWSGFNGIKVDGQFNPDPSVTNIGRIVLNHTEGTSERSWTFDAKNISDDTVQYDLNNVGTGTISLKNLSEAVETVNIKGIKGTSANTTDGGDPQNVQLDFAMGANSGKADAITLGVNDVCATGGKVNIKGLVGIEDVTVNATGEASRINLENVAQATSIKVTGDADLTITNSASGVKTYDASAATGNVNFGAANFGKDVVIGGSGHDTVTYNGAASGKANWTSIEYVTLTAGGEVNVADVTGLEELWVYGTNSNKLTHLTADTFSVYQNGNATAIEVNGNKGSLQDITWVGMDSSTDDPATIKGQFKSNATGNVTLQIADEDKLDTGSTFMVKDATGTVTLNSPNDSGDNIAITLTADEATALVVNVVGGLTINQNNATGNTGKVQDVTITLENASENEDTPDAFTLMSNLTSAQNIKVEGGGEDVTLGDIGSDKGVGVTLNAVDVNNMTIGTITEDTGANINVTIEAAKDVSLGNMTSSTNRLGNAEGDITLNVTGKSVTGDANLEADDLFINLSGIEDTVALGTLKADGNIQYEGAEGADTFTIAKLGVGSTSQVTLGDGDDELTLDAATLLSKGKATLMIDGGDDTSGDTVKFENSPASGFVTAYLSGIEKVEGTVSLGNGASVDDINAVLAKAGLGEITAADGAAGQVLFAAADGNYYGVLGSETGALIIISDFDCASAS